MKIFILPYIICFFLIGTCDFAALSQNTTYFMPSDSISFSINGIDIYQNLWRNGTLVNSIKVCDSDSVHVSFNEITLIEDEDGIAIVSNKGDYAYLDISDEYQYHVLTIGNSSNNKVKCRIFFDISNNIPQYYIDSSDNIYEIVQIDKDLSYLINKNNGEIYILNNHNPTERSRSRAIMDFLQDFLFDCISTAQNIGNTINDTLDEIIENLSDGKFNTTDISNAKSIFDFLKGISNILNAYDALKSLLNIEFFSNVHISTGTAEVSALNACLHASVRNIPPGKCTYSKSFRYEKVVDYSYILGLEVSDFSSNKVYKKDITDNGDYSFTHICSQYDHGYFYESILGLKVIVEIDMDILYEECKLDWPSTVPIPTGKEYVTRAWSISGGTRNFRTDAPNICGNWTAVWHTTPPNAKLLTMTLSESGECTQTYYYANRDQNVSYTCNYSYNYPTLTLYKDNGDIQHWEITDYTPNSMTLQASDGFCYYLSK